MTLPNIISLARLLSVPFNVWLILIDQWRLALVVFCLAGLSDAIDGFLAKKFGMQSRLGQYLDPIADKVLLVSIFIVLGAQQHLPLWLVILVVSRDILIVGGLLLLYVFAQSYEPKPFLSSKLNTATQIVLAALVIASLAFSFEWAAVYVQGLIVATALTTIASGTEYMIEWWRRMNRLEQG
ncbi:MAG: CDP-alcohol phosphatidyltransferase family protein [Rhodospirillaceae bacterium]|jgi:cardiolipin synthase (CMP-forming)|nr:CDP-alcohol phosphatidyltransferase family protein [Rhodospirillaceae bacterium]MBT5896417.1 CDP-alcohol phosphatidyltransferase family protein [Rhodospirillaceae bacterium]MBT6427406.1 CDP-alcohol phosphatidyltransferase family protein [Rhodospirillaceae bacterium]